MTATVSPQGAPRPTSTPAPATALVDDTRLKAAIEEALGEERDKFAVAVIRPADGRAAFVAADRVFYAASLFKLAVLYEAALRISRGELVLDEKVRLTEEDLAEDLGTAARLPLDEENQLPLGDALRAMVMMSDNATAVALLHLLGGAAIDATLREVGATTTSVNTREQPTTARDMALLMEAILVGRGLNEPTHRLVLESLAAQETRLGIPAGLPRGTPAGNKTGTWEAATHDVAWVEAPGGRYVVAVLSATDRDWRRIAAVSEAIYQEMSR